MKVLPNEDGGSGLLSIKVGNRCFLQGASSPSPCQVQNDQEMPSWPSNSRFCCSGTPGCLILSGYPLLVLCLWDLYSFSHFLPFPSLQNQAMGNLRGSFLRALSTVWCADRIPTNRRKWSCMAGPPISWKKRWTTSKMWATRGCFVFLSFEAARRVGSEAWMGMLSRHFESLIWIGNVSLFLCGDAKGMGIILQQASLGWLLLTSHESQGSCWVWSGGSWVVLRKIPDTYNVCVWAAV